MKKVNKAKTLDDIGEISAAKIHRDANRILKQINKFDKNTKFCPCCCLPCPTPGVLVRFSYCDNTNDFIETGQGTSLYFFFFKYSMIIMAATAIIIGIPFLIFSYQYTYSLQEICNNYYRKILGLYIVFQPAFYLYLLIGYILYCTYTKDKKSLIIGIFLFIYYLTCFLGPCAIVRYMYNVIVVTPIMIGYLIKRKGNRG